MKHYLILYILLLLSPKIFSQFVVLPDSIFRDYLLKQYPTCFNEKKQMDTTCKDIINEIELVLDRKNISDITGIKYFNNLLILRSNYNNLSFLPILPKSLEKIYCVGNQISKIVAFPENLKILYASNNKISVLPDLPNHLSLLEVASNQLPILPSLPNNLQYLYCFENQLASLPLLPKGLKILVCKQNHLSFLPALPDSINYIDCSFNKLKQLPNLSQKLKTLNCERNILDSIPPLPKELTELNCSENKLSVIPSLPISLKKLDCSANKITTLTNLPDSLESLDVRYITMISFPSLPTTLQELRISSKRVESLPILPLKTFLRDNDGELYYNSSTYEETRTFIEESNGLMFLVTDGPAFKDSLVFSKYVIKNMKPYKEFNKGRFKDTVTVQFLVETDGNISNIRILKGKYKNLNTEAIRIIKSTEGKWLPFNYRRNNVRTIINRMLIFK